MSTSINVTIGGSGLPDKAKQQTQSNRFQKLEADAKANAEKQAKAQREQKLKAEGKGPDGKPLANAPLQYDPRVDELAAFRNVNPGMSCAWHFSRVKEQPSYFWFPYNNVENTIFATTTKFYYANKIYSGDGSAKYEYDAGYDDSDLWTAPTNGPPPSDPYYPYVDWAATPRRASLNDNFSNPIGEIDQWNSGGSSRAEGISIILPVAKNLLIYYSYVKRHRAYQFLNSQKFGLHGYSAEGTYYESAGVNVWGLGNPIYRSNTEEFCLLISNNSIKPLNVPSALREILLASVSRYSFFLRDRQLHGEGNVYYDGVPFRDIATDYSGLYSYITVPGFGWQRTVPTYDDFGYFGINVYNNPPSYAKYTAPLGYLPWVANQPWSQQGLGSYYSIKTGGLYELLVNDPNTNYSTYSDKAPQVAAKASDNGFTSGESWEEIYDNATVLEHVASKGKPSSIYMSDNRIARPVDPLVYSVPTSVSVNGYNMTSNWLASLFIGYDWANARYCRDQLMKLGFTASDLTP